MKNDYSVRIYSPSNLLKDWYVYIYSVSQKKIIKRFSEGLNDFTTFEDRMLQSLSIKKHLETEIKGGWEPKKSKLPSAEDFHYNIIEAYDLALESICSSYGLSPASEFHYKTHHRQIVKTIKSLGYDKVDVREFEAYHISIILEECQKKYKGSNNFYNKHLKSCKRVFKEIERKFIIKSNPATVLLEKEYKKKDKRLLTPEEYSKVIAHFEKLNPHFVTFIYCVELGIRPTYEARLLRFGMIKTIEIRDKKFYFFDIPETLTKNRKRKLVPVTPKILERLPDLTQYPDDYYLFGSTRKRLVTPTQFIPSETSMSEDVANRLWKEEVKEAFGIDTNLYFLKSKNANDMREDGVDLSVIKDLFGHSKEEITKIYATKDYEIRMMEVAEKLNPILKIV